MGNEVEKTIKQVMSACFDVPVEDILDDASPDTIGSWDSLSHMNLVLALEEEFKTEFTDKEIVEMMNFRLIVEVVNNK